MGVVREPPVLPTSVDNDVFGEIAHVDEGFVADGAFVGSDVIVVADVVGQLARLHEPEGEKHSGHNDPCPQR